jgi:hypothetical protein
MNTLPVLSLPALLLLFSLLNVKYRKIKLTLAKNFLGLNFMQELAVPRHCTSGSRI